MNGTKRKHEIALEKQVSTAKLRWEVKECGFHSKGNRQPRNNSRKVNNNVKYSRHVFRRNYV